MKHWKNESEEHMTWHFSFWKKLCLLLCMEDMCFVLFCWWWLFACFLIHSFKKVFFYTLAYIFTETLSLPFFTQHVWHKQSYEKPNNKDSSYYFILFYLHLDCVFRQALGFLVHRLSWMHPPGLRAYLKMFAVKSSVFTLYTFWLNYGNLLSSPPDHACG